jgi:hypothetical protein
MFKHINIIHSLNKMKIGVLGSDGSDSSTEQSTPGKNRDVTRKVKSKKANNTTPHAEYQN